MCKNVLSSWSNLFYQTTYICPEIGFILNITLGIKFPQILVLVAI